MDDATREVRFAVVLYGGVSLAIYMNGISQELLHMVRGSASPRTLGAADEEKAREQLSEVERIYRDLSKALSGDGRRTRFIIDIISGTSAGGINGVALAKALALGSRDLKVLRRAWAVEADFENLLNDRIKISALGKTESLLDGHYMYDMLLKTLGEMNQGTSGRSLADDTLDLFVTATDLEGRWAPIYLTDKSMDERIHKSVFRFQYIAGDDNAAPPQRNDFGEEEDSLLAFAARCTSSFPVAFPPSRLDAIPEKLRNRPRDFGDIPAGEKDDFESRLFADGGYLDNRPFSHAIDLIPFRTPTVSGERKLLFVDPFPETKAERSQEMEVDFLRNAMLAATTLPRREVIREDIHDITEMNRRLSRLGALQDRWARDQEKLQTLGAITPHARKPDNFEELDLADLVDLGYGRHYPLYHHLRVYGTTDLLTDFVTQIAGYELKSDQWSYLRQVIRAWRDQRFYAYHPEGGSSSRPGSCRSETFYLTQYDLDFRLRRLSHLRVAIDAALNEPGAEEELLWDALAIVKREHWNLRRLRSPGSEELGHLLAADEIAELRNKLTNGYEEVMSRISLKDRYAAATEIYHDRVKDQVDKAMETIGAKLRAASETSSKRIRGFIEEKGLESILEAYDRFHWHDNVTFPFLEGSSAQENADVQVFRISPADSEINDDPAKLAGIKVRAFGGFLNRDWREHDILWGRLDGAERIVAALMPGPDKSEDRAIYTKRLQEAILKDEFETLESGDARRLALVKARLRASQIDDETVDQLAAGALGEIKASAFDVPRFQKYATVQPAGPNAIAISGWTSRSARILARMIDGLPSSGFLGFAGPRIARPLRAGGLLSAHLANFALPGSFQRMVANHVLMLAMLAGLLVVVIAAIAGSAQSAAIGGIIVVVAATLWVLLYTFGRILRERPPLPLLLRRIAIVVLVTIVLLLAGYGGWSLWNEWQTLSGN
ncbi:patatin-like protein [Sedimentitalea sp. JM2-8]|uniref:Patatin-like protein n=1 Tax=Sedimentitalea xiamensis TaxID=3050037 RepID=A0ABT7FKG3_9RHOB|nr:patatin-like protein [Sedimentitalea xiamensis]MDK3075638.1 patatin-like protein [Sedimentitalea xiamensis]